MANTKEKIKRNKVIILIMIAVLILAGTGIGIWRYQHQKNQEIYDYCVKVYVKTGYKYLSLDECIDMVKKAGGINKLKEHLEEIK